jgi:hypothetical protein
MRFVYEMGAVLCAVSVAALSFQVTMAALSDDGDIVILAVDPAIPT